MDLCTILPRRVLLALHHSFAGKTIANSAYYFSRHLCHGSSLILLDALFSKLQRSLSTVYVNERLLKTAGGVFKSVLVQSTAALCLGLIRDLVYKHFELCMVITKSQQSRY